MSAAYVGREHHFERLDGLDEDLALGEAQHEVERVEDFLEDLAGVALVGLAAELGEVLLGDLAEGLHQVHEGLFPEHV